jgi:ATP-dependent DNA helicase RecG
MATTLVEIEDLLKAREDEHLEFKEAKNQYDYDKLGKYCSALANEGGGKMILGITDKMPRIVVGSLAFPNLPKIKSALIEALQLRIETDEIAHPKGRIVVFTVPSRPVGMPVRYRGVYWMRRDEDVVPMTDDMVKRIFDEIRLDASADISHAATIEDLDPLAITELRARWHRKSGNDRLLEMSDKQLLADAELMIDGGITNAALILLGTATALNRLLAQSEVVFEYRSSEASGPAQQRKEFRKGFLLFQEELWNLINSRNDLQHFQVGMYKVPIQTFNEVIVREAIANAVSHRDYSAPGSVFVRQTPRTMEVSSPGGFPSGVNQDNVLWKQVPRNRRLAEVLGRCGLVERSGQGVNLMYEESIKESKPLPDFSGSDEHNVDLVIRGEIQDPQFLRFLDKIGKEKLATFHTKDLLIIDMIHREQAIPEEYKSRLPYLVAQGVVEKRRGGKEYVLSGSFHKFMGQRGTYTRKIGLDRETNKMLLLKLIEDSSPEGCQLKELMQVLPEKTRGQVQYLLALLRIDGKAHYRSFGMASTWYPGPHPDYEVNDHDDDADDDDIDDEGRTPKAEDRTPKAESALQNAEGRTPKAEQGSLYSEDSEELA